MYSIEFSRKARKQFKALPELVRDRLIPKIDSLTENPRPSDCKALQGTKGLYRVRVGDYRILYSIEDRRLFILIVEIGHRREIYRDR
ncbi:type II toxin-antitoxin system RelE/ParE family toxin [Pannus brasiliensis CCIBt3594]|uniref:Type II toxin-antitoxin system RelE/ParE family toxin n=1 Tax=Pannus brasiliensis CCIBt3594 TaxID=1427578 RepID=A0AAW9QUD5_9CHRO